jgi:phage terminase small subunit
MSTSSHPASLNPRQVLFVEEYLIDLNGKEAAIRAGYTREAAAVRASKLLRRPAVRQAVAAAMAARAERSRAFFEGGITPERVIAEYGRIAFADRRRFGDWGPDHVRFSASRTLSDDDRAAVAEIAEAAGGIKRVKLFDKQAALNSLSRIFAHADSARFRPSGVAADPLPAAPKPIAAPLPLSDRQCRFADEFLKDLNASAAARRAGYAPTSAPFRATKLRRYPGIAARIDAGMAKKQRTIRVTADRVLAEYARIAFADIGRVADWTNRRLLLKSKRPLERASGAALAFLGPARGARLQVRLHDKVYALDMLARHLGLLDPQMPGRALKQKWPVQRTSAALRQRLGR